jgi:hypothetical protein
MSSSSSLSPPGAELNVPDLFKQEVYAVLREWLIEANRLAVEEGGTYASVLGRALDNLTKEGREVDG